MAMFCVLESHLGLTFFFPHLATRLSWATLLVCKMGGFQFQESQEGMVRVGVSLGEMIYILYNCTDLETMEKSTIAIPFRRGQEMHVFTLRALIDLCYLANLPIINMNSSTSMFELLVFSSSNHILCFLLILIFVVLIDLQGIAFKLVNPLAMISLFWN
jgi:hypothetical protein